MAVLDPVKVIIENYQENQTEWVSIENNPEDEQAGKREMPFSKEIWIEREDFMEEAPKKFFRLTLGQEVRLKGANIIKANSVKKDENGKVTTIYATYDPDSKSGSGTEASNRKVKGTIHWVSVKEAISIEVRLYDRLFTVENPDENDEIDFLQLINPNSLQIVQGFAEPSLKNAQIEQKFQFQRLGYFCVDQDSKNEKLIFNRTATLRDTWAKVNH